MILSAADSDMGHDILYIAVEQRTEMVNEKDVEVMILFQPSDFAFAESVCIHKGIAGDSFLFHHLPEWFVRYHILFLLPHSRISPSVESYKSRICLTAHIKDTIFYYILVVVQFLRMEGICRKQYPCYCIFLRFSQHFHHLFAGLRKKVGAQTNTRFHLCASET